MDALWGLLPYILLFVLFFVLPGLARRRHGAEVERRFSLLQRKRKTRIIAVVHREEAMGLLGMAQLRYIDLNDAEDVLRAIRSTPPDQPIEMILHTPGGLVLPALQIARALKAHPARKTIFVPHYAMSGGTLIAMAADEVILDSHAVLGPIDPQLGGLPAASIASVVAQKDPNAVQDYTLVLADIAAKAQMQLERAARELLSGTVSDNAAVSIAKELSSGRWTHDYPIEAAEAAEMGLPVRTGMPDEIAELLALFPSRLSGRSVTYSNEPLTARLFGRRREVLPPPSADDTALREQPSFRGYEPGAGARSFSYGPWNPADLRKGPAQEDMRRRLR